MTYSRRSFRGNVANLMLDLQVALAEGSGQFKSVSSKLCNNGLSTVLEATRASGTSQLREHAHRAFGKLQDEINASNG